MPRISWAPDGRRVLVFEHGALRIVSTDTCETLREIPQRTANYFDGHWLRDGRIAAVDIYGIAMQFTMHGEPYGELPPERWRRGFVGLSGNGQELVEIDYHRLFVYTTSQKRHRWEVLEPARWYGMSGPYRHAALSYDGMRIAIACDGWHVLDITPKPIDYSGSWQCPVLARGNETATAFVFDRSGTRLVIATTTGTSAIRLDTAAAPIPASEPTACVALDDRGIRAAYGFASRSELRVDYLSPKRSTVRHVEVLDQHRIDAGLAPVALAFDAEGTTLACLAADGRVEIVPVP